MISPRTLRPQALLVPALLLWACPVQETGDGPDARDEICDDRRDNDNDGATDCNDADCFDFEGCDGSGDFGEWGAFASGYVTFEGEWNDDGRLCGLPETTVDTFYLTAESPADPGCVGNSVIPCIRDWRITTMQQTVASNMFTFAVTDWTGLGVTEGTASEWTTYIYNGAAARWEIVSEASGVPQSWSGAQEWQDFFDACPGSYRLIGRQRIVSAFQSY